METSRRGFIKAAGLAALGLVVARPVIDVFSRTESAQASLVADTPMAAKLAPTTRWGMAVNLTACAQDEGCTACIDACHSYHNVPDIPGDEEIKWIYKAPYEKVFPESENEFIDSGIKNVPVLLLCNHCEFPPCTKVCPTRATFKREDGIVMMDYHRCIGCRYCMAGCPYGARSFNWREPRPYIKEINPDFPTRTRGVVEKCDFCAKRLSEGLLPACVEACPESLTFGNLLDEESEISKILKTYHIIRRAPELGTEPNVYYYYT